MEFKDLNQLFNLLMKFRTTKFKDQNPTYNVLIREVKNDIVDKMDVEQFNKLVS